MDAASIAGLQTEIVRAVVGDVPDVLDGEWGDRTWAHIFVDFELGRDGASSSISFSLAHTPGRDLEKVAFRLSPATKGLFGDLAAAMIGPDGSRWSSIQMKVESDGRFSFDVFHAPPLRLGGTLIDDRFRDYLYRWLQTEDGLRFLDPPAATVADQPRLSLLSRLFGRSG